MINATMAKFCPEVTVVARGPRYSAAELLAAFPPARLKYDVTTSSQHWPQLTEEHEPVITKAADRVSSLEPMLWQGDWAKVTSSDGTQAYLSQSEADFALAKAIAQNLAGSYTNLAELPPLAEAVFFRSGLARREKWQTRQNYRMATVNRACAIIHTEPSLDLARAARGLGSAA